MIEKFIGIPWKVGACGYDAADCWGLVRLFLRDECHIDLQKHIGASFRGRELSDVLAAESASPEWIFTRAPKRGDVALIFEPATNRPAHVAVCVDTQHVLHSIHSGPNGFSQINPIKTLARMFPKIEFYSYAGTNKTQ